MARHYSQHEKHLYVWRCVQGIVNLERRSREVVRLSALHELSDEQVATLGGMLAHLDARRRDNERVRQERASMSPLDFAITHPTRNNLIGLRSGRDRFTRLGLAAMREAAGDRPEIEGAELSESGKAAAYRWVMRGLPVAHSVQKIKLHEAVAGRKASRHFDFDDDENRAAFEEWRDEQDDATERERAERKPMERQKRPAEGEIQTYLAGAKYRDTSSSVIGPVELEWEPTNPHDPNAIKIMQHGVHLGYVPKDLAPRIHHGFTARLTVVGHPWTVIIKQPEFPTFVLPKLFVGLG